MAWTIGMTEVVAMYGAVVSTILLVIKWKEDQPKIRVEVQISPSDSELDQLIRQYPNHKFLDQEIIISAKNIGKIPVYLTSLGLVFQGKKFGVTFCGSNQHGYCEVSGEYDILELPQGIACHGHEKLPEFINQAKKINLSKKIKINGYAIDLCDREYKSKSFDIDLDRKRNTDSSSI